MLPGHRGFVPGTPGWLCHLSLLHKPRSVCFLWAPWLIHVLSLWRFPFFWHRIKDTFVFLIPFRPGVCVGDQGIIS